jgi:hypothetical protein
MNAVFPARSLIAIPPAEAIVSLRPAQDHGPRPNEPANIVLAQICAIKALRWRGPRRRREEDISGNSA